MALCQDDYTVEKDRVAVSLHPYRQREKKERETDGKKGINAQLGGIDI